MKKYHDMTISSKALPVENSLLEICKFWRQLTLESKAKMTRK
jgi:hypothetical protein